jgi:hypothetical protein
VAITATQQRGEIEALVETNDSEKVLALLADVVVPEDCERIATETLRRFEKVEDSYAASSAAQQSSAAKRVCRFVHFSFILRRFWMLERALGGGCPEP